MGEREEEILNKLKAEAKQFELPVENFVWDAIQMEITKEETKKGGLFWWIIGVLIVMAAVLYSFNFNLTSSKSVNEDQQSWPESIGKVINSLKSSKHTKQDFNQNVSSEMNDLETIDDCVDVPVINTPESLNLGNVQDRLKQIGPEKTTSEENYISQLFNLSPKPIQLNATYKDLVRPTYNTVINSITKKESKRELTFLFHAGLGESFRILNSGVHHDLIAHKNDHETYGNCFAIGLDAQFKISERLIGRTGVGYKFYSDKYDFQHDLITHTTRNDYQYFQMPFLLGFKALQRSKSKLFILGGVKANFLFSAQSSWVDLTALAPVAHSNNSTNSPFRNVTGAINLGLDYNYELTRQLRLHIIPTAETFVNSVYKRNTEINQRLFSFNLDVGISYTFK